MTSSRVNISLLPELLTKAHEYNINVNQVARDDIVAGRIYDLIREQQEV